MLYRGNSFPTRRDKLNVFLDHAQTRVLEDTRMYKNLPVPSIKLNIELELRDRRE